MNLEKLLIISLYEFFVIKHLLIIYALILTLFIIPKAFIFKYPPMRYYAYD